MANEKSHSFAVVLLSRENYISKPRVSAEVGYPETRMQEGGLCHHFETFYHIIFYILKPCGIIYSDIGLLFHKRDLTIIF